MNYLYGALFVIIVFGTFIKYIVPWLEKPLVKSPSLDALLESYKSPDLYKYRNKIEDCVAQCDPCEKNPDRFSGYQLHKRLYPTGTTLSKGIPNLECLMCGNKKEAKYEGKAI